MSYQRLEIYRPTNSKKLTQGWGENRACIDSYGRITGAAIACPRGTQSFYKSIGMKGHNGIDIAEYIGADIYHAASFDGWMKTEKDPSGGIGVDVISYEPLFFEGEAPEEIRKYVGTETHKGVKGFTSFVKMRYWHLKSPVGFDGKKVSMGKVIGLSGNSGASSGPHLHFAPKWCLRNGIGIGSENGFYGAFDPTPFYKHDILAFDQAKFIEKTDVDLTENERKDIEQQITLIQSLRRLITLLTRLV